MYKVYCDSFLLYTDTISSLKIHSAKVDLEVNKTGAFNFTIHKDHPYYNFIYKMKSIITVYQDDFLLFRGRALNIEYGFHNEKIVKCEGELAFLLDTMVRPYSFSGSITDYLTMLIDSHNAQVEESHRFTVGRVTVTDPNNYITRSDEEYVSTWNLIEDKLVDNLGGYILVRHEGDVNYIDYLSDFTLLSSQKVEFGKNLLSFKRAVKGENIATALIPLGAKLSEDSAERLTIKDVNGGLDYIYDADAVNLYGYIYAINTWDDVTVASNLLRKGQEYLASLVEPISTIDLSAADLATLDSSVTSFHIGTYVTVKSEPHGINQNFMVQKLSINLLNPASNSLTLGGKVEASFTEQSLKVVQSGGGSGGKGPKGDPGLPGTPGADGRSSYFHVKYSANADGNPMTETPDKYIGTYVDYTEADSDDSSKYTWTLFQGSQGEKGEQGIPGENGEDGQTSYLHIAYATSADGSTGFSLSDGTNKTYIGQYTDFEEDDSTDYTKYKWTKIKGEDGNDGKDAAIQSDTAPTDTSYLWLDTSMSPPQLKRYNPDTQTWEIVNDMTDVIYNLEQNLQASITTSETNIMSTVSEQYYLKEDADKLVSDISTTIEQTKNEISFQFNTFQTDVSDWMEGTDAEFLNISKYIRFVDGSIILGEVNNPLELVIEKEQITFKQDGVPVAYFSNNKLSVTHGEYKNSLQLGNFKFEPRTNGNLSFKKVK